MSEKAFDVIVIGAGHAGVEAALAAARMGCAAALVTLSKATIGLMSCNPAIGGVGKGQLVKEIDALGGEMGLAADRTGVQFRQLNASKGQAVRSSRCQSDRKRYQQYMQQVVGTHSGITVIEDMAAEICVDFSRMQIQHSDPDPVPFSFRTPAIPPDQKLLPCFITRTTERTHEIIRKNFHLSPMYSGQIDATGVRYCPSIEDKLKKFSDKESHHVFLEPEGLDSDLYYPNGISTGLPEDVQEQMVHSIPGLERAVIAQPGYSIEHGAIPPTQIRQTLETKQIRGLFLAGQVNGTTGYEEAGAQGLIAGINAALQVMDRPPLILGRHESYTGVLIDDLTTRGTEEPYRMFTSRVEYRLVVREDNADQRLAGYACDLGLMTRQEYDRVLAKYQRVDAEIAMLKDTRILPGSDIGRRLSERLEERGSSRLTHPASLADILKRPEADYRMLADCGTQLSPDQRKEIEQVEYQIKYEGFINRQAGDIERLRHVESIKIPADLDFSAIPGLSIEIRQKLTRFGPRTLGQAHRISGVTPAAALV